MDGFGNYTLNKNYGGGHFNRRIILQQHDGYLYGALEDCNHGFQVRIDFSDGVITAVNPEFMRVPFSSCGGAVNPIQELIGMPLTASIKELIKHTDPVKHCTHLYDLCCWTIAHSQRKSTEVIYDIEVTDAIDGVTELFVKRNNDIIHQWQAKDGAIQSPKNLKDKPLFLGFYHWVRDMFDGEALEAALVLQKGNLVSIGRMIDVDGMAGGRAIDEHERHACHTYSPENNKQAIRLAGTMRDFTHEPEKLLTFS